MTGYSIWGFILGFPYCGKVPESFPAKGIRHVSGVMGVDFRGRQLRNPYSLRVQVPDGTRTLRSCASQIIRPSYVVPLWVVHYNRLPKPITDPKKNYIGALALNPKP